MQTPTEDTESSPSLPPCVQVMQTMYRDVSERLEAQDLCRQIAKRGELLDADERCRLGDRLLELVHECAPRLVGVEVPRLADCDSLGYPLPPTEDVVASPPSSPDETLSASLVHLFPVRLYSASVTTLAGALTRPCDCEQPEISHAHCSADCTTIYAFDEAWWLSYCCLQCEVRAYTMDNIMAKPERVREFCESLKCPYDALKDDRRDELLDWVATDESLGWEPPPERRAHFVESGRYESVVAEFDEKSSDAHSLADAYERWLRNEPSERRRAKIAANGMNVVVELGTSDGYVEIRTVVSSDDPSRMYFYVPYFGGANRESVDVLLRALREEHDNRLRLPEPEDYYTAEYMQSRRRCRCGKDSLEHTGYVNDHRSVSRRQLDVVLRNVRPDDRHRFVVLEGSTMIAPDLMAARLAAVGCPHLLLSDQSNVLSLLASRHT